MIPTIIRFNNKELIQKYRININPKSIKQKSYKYSNEIKLFIIF